MDKTFYSETYTCMLIYFNVHTKFYGWYDDRNWLKNRINIFENITLKSIENQTDTDFDCIVMFCKNLLDEEDILKINSWKRIIPLYLGRDIINPNKDFIPFIREKAKDKKYILTTTMDNDDLIHCYYISLIKEQCILDKALNFPNGYNYKLGNDFLTQIKWKNGSIYSLLEKNDKNIKTVRFVESHKDFFNCMKSNIIYGNSKRPIWIQFDHGILSIINRCNKKDEKLGQNIEKIKLHKKKHLEKTSIKDKKIYLSQDLMNFFGIFNKDILTKKGILIK